MAIGRTFEEALGKAMRSLENGRAGLGADGKDRFEEHKFDEYLAVPNEERVFYIAEALRRGREVAEIHDITHIDPWFLGRIARIVQVERELEGRGLDRLSADELKRAKRHGLSDVQIAYLTGATEASVRAVRKALGVRPTFKSVDTCAAEFAAYTPYYYKTYEDEDEVAPSRQAQGDDPRRRPQPHRPGHRVRLLLRARRVRAVGHGLRDDHGELQPRDGLDRLRHERPPLLRAAHLRRRHGHRRRREAGGCVVTFGGQTPLKLANALEAAGVPIMGTKPEAIDLAEDRKRFSAVLDELGIAYPAAGTARSYDEALAVARRIGFPLLVRPSYVLGGRGMVIAYYEEYLERYMAEAVSISPEHPVLLDSFLEGAIEVDVDAVCDGETVYVGGVMEHIEEAGIHSGDSACSHPAVHARHRHRRSHPRARARPRACASACAA